ncbi:MAG: 3-deoxy-D-manno-octulosonic acid transferase [Pirellulaceae bacterium]
MLYLAAILVASPYLLYAAIRYGKYREGWRQKLLGSVPIRSGKNRCIWLHAVSVGEVNLLAPLIARWDAQYPDWECVISTTTLAGYALARKRYAPRTVFYCPLDFTWSVRRAIRRMRPDLLVLAELELWPNLVAAAKQAGAKVAIINGRLSDKSLRGYQRIGFLARKTLEQIDLVAAQNEEYAQRFRQLGALPSAVAVTRSIKFDGAIADRQNPATKRLAALAGIEETDQVFLAGSTQEPEESLAVAVYSKLVAQHPKLRLILVPRHPERFEEVARMLEKSGVPWQRRSLLESEGPKPQARILLVDTIGELTAWWGTAAIAFVGGSLGKRGGQNMIEPAAYGAAVCFGPNTWNFRDVVEMLLAREAAVVVQDGTELKGFVRRCLENPDYAQVLGQNARALVLEQLGAADRTVELLSALVSSQTASRRAA